MQREFAYRTSATLTTLMEDADRAKLSPIFHNVAFIGRIIQAAFINGTDKNHFEMRKSHLPHYEVRYCKEFLILQILLREHHAEMVQLATDITRRYGYTSRVVNNSRHFNGASGGP